MTEWLNEGNPPAAFTLEDEAELRSAMEHGGIIRCKQQDLMSERDQESPGQRQAGDQAGPQLGRNPELRAGDDLSIKRLKFSEELREQNDDVTSEDPPPAWTPTSPWSPPSSPSSSGPVCRPGR